MQIISYAATHLQMIEGGHIIALIFVRLISNSLISPDSCYKINSIMRVKRILSQQPVSPQILVRPLGPGMKSTQADLQLLTKTRQHPDTGPSLNLLDIKVSIATAERRKS